MGIEFKQLSLEEFYAFIEEAKVPKYRASQILDWVYGKGVSSYGNMSNLPKSMREQLASLLPLNKPAIAAKQVSRDGSRKYLIEFSDECFVETVGLPTDEGKLSVCASSQCGCAMGCIFCATGKTGFTRNLYPGEIADQIQVVQDDFGRRVTNVVIMGQGEPFSNYDNTLAALRILNNSRFYNIGARHITVSSCGVIEGIKRFAEEPEQFTLAVSLHSAVQKTRNSIMPAMRNQKLDNLRSALIHYSQQTGRRYSFEYALMDSVNDSTNDLNAFINFCKGLLCHVNLIPLNDVEGSPARPPHREKLELWKETLQANGIAATIRKSRGEDILAACGQLSSARDSLIDATC